MAHGCYLKPQARSAGFCDVLVHWFPFHGRLHIRLRGRKPRTSAFNPDLWYRCRCCKFRDLPTEQS